MDSVVAVCPPPHGGSAQTSEDEAALTEISRLLLDWSSEHLPDFPWRHGEDPYALWVAVVMLQQTQVATMLPYFERFTRAFPTLSDLAAADLTAVLKVWEGLGYYARARNLHRAAQSLVAQGQQGLPSCRSELLDLPGVGEYTAGAILSIAFGRDEPAIDANVRRVVSRLFAVDADPRRAATKQVLAQLAARLLPRGKAGEFNQGLMEFGATVCTARSPQCDACPLKHLCIAACQGRQEELPRRVTRQPSPHYDVTAAVIWKRGRRVLVTQRREDDMLGGLWEFPGGRCETGESLEGCLRREIEEELSLHIEVGERIVTVEHAYSHFRISLHAYHARIVDGHPQALECADWRWCSLDDLADLPFSVADQAIIRALSRSVSAEG